eukprot:CAMPEP_0117476062 /NCGR_PEP_ID=MMETSP0784-20121206/10117_1 /TAXON_ID=39447 /ORGANISM="" /LENGTH=103 /DNA_ID=CAMNT_0005270329 /DNA_START=339 /DNA_END=648 /DNA_ORIENTATION=-
MARYSALVDAGLNTRFMNRGFPESEMNEMPTLAGDVLAQVADAPDMYCDVPIDDQTAIVDLEDWNRGMRVPAARTSSSSGFLNSGLDAVLENISAGCTAALQC